MERNITKEGGGIRILRQTDAHARIRKYHIELHSGDPYIGCLGSKQRRSRCCMGEVLLRGLKEAKGGEGGST